MMLSLTVDHACSWKTVQDNNTREVKDSLASVS